MLTEQQIKERKNYIGGSDCAAVLGMSRWGSPLTVWMEKTGQSEVKEENLAMKLGNKLEQIVAELFMEETGKKVRRVNETVFHPDYPFIGANVDRKIEGEDAILEIKTASGWKAKEWDDNEIPEEYILQVMHYLAVTGREKGYIAVLIGGNQDFKWKEIVRDNELVASIIEKEVLFWNNYVVPKVMPMTFTSIDGDPLGQLFSKPENLAIVPAIDDLNECFKDLEFTKNAIKELEDEKKSLENRLKAEIGNNLGITTSKYQATWNIVKKEAHEVKASEYRMLRIKELKGE